MREILQMFVGFWKRRPCVGSSVSVLIRTLEKAGGLRIVAFTGPECHAVTVGHLNEVVVDPLDHARLRRGRIHTQSATT